MKGFSPPPRFNSSNTYETAVPETTLDFPLPSTTEEYSTLHIDFASERPRSVDGWCLDCGCYPSSTISPELTANNKMIADRDQVTATEAALEDIDLNNSATIHNVIPVNRWPPDLGCAIIPADSLLEPRGDLPSPGSLYETAKRGEIFDTTNCFPAPGKTQANPVNDGLCSQGSCGYSIPSPYDGHIVSNTGSFGETPETLHIKLSGSYTEAPYKDGDNLSECSWPDIATREDVNKRILEPLILHSGLEAFHPIVIKNINSLQRGKIHGIYDLERRLMNDARVRTLFREPPLMLIYRSSSLGTIFY